MVYFSIPTTSTSTNKIILDHLLYLSIQSRLQQDQQLTNYRSTSCQTTREKQNKAVESMVTGILSSHRNSASHHHELDFHFGQRLHLCQLTALVLGRYDKTAGLYDLPPVTTHHHQQTSCIPYHCRQHRRLDCATCHIPPTRRSFSSALVQAIPLFLKTTADTLRQTLDAQQKDKTPMMVDGEKVMGGGLPRTWYNLFLDLMTQAVIEAYLCDGQFGMESIVSVFSYGYVEEDEEEDEEEEDGDSDDDNSYCAADHHLLFPKTRTMFIFKTQVMEREQEVSISENINKYNSSSLYW
ncbi:hypothetical protein BC941DRAFT_445089 [Chlamydoabsidia padenii]|nr:hypothetical protein BC941DRAFT_445089 [Chlamydoabsidia padenii]